MCPKERHGQGRHGPRQVGQRQALHRHHQGGIITEASRGPDVSKHHAQLFLSSSHKSSTRGFSHFTDKEGKGQG